LSILEKEVKSMERKEKKDIEKMTREIIDKVDDNQKKAVTVYFEKLRGMMKTKTSNTQDQGTQVFP
jgi:hypothetical protein